MKYSLKISLLILAMFVIAQFIGLFVAGVYSPQIFQVETSAGEVENITTHNLPYGTEPPGDTTPKTTLISIIFALIIAVFLMFILMKYKAEIILKTWFFIVVILAISLALNAFLINFAASELIALIIAIPLAILKIFKRNIIVHNLTELIIYPGIAAVFIPLLNIWTVFLLLVFISAYDMYAVWSAGFMQKMAKYQIQKLKIFAGFFIPFLGEKQRSKIKDLSPAQLKKMKNKKINVNVAMLGGGDVVFPIITAGVILNSIGLAHALFISLGATLGLAFILKISEKGKFYPAMPFISLGILLGFLTSLII
jgi:presenilin-like A22 family membrane protease